MALVVEDGTVVAGADSYVSRSDYIAHAAAFGVTVPDEDATDVELRKAAQFIDSHEPNLKGSRVSREQPLSFPRRGLCIEGFEWAEDEIPRQVVLAQFAVAMDYRDGIDPYNPPANPSRAVRRTRVEGAVEVEYMGSDSGAKLSRESRTEALMASLLVRNGLVSVPLVRR